MLLEKHKESVLCNTQSNASVDVRALSIDAEGANSDGGGQRSQGSDVGSCSRPVIDSSVSSIRGCVGDVECAVGVR